MRDSGTNEHKLRRGDINRALQANYDAGIHIICTTAPISAISTNRKAAVGCYWLLPQMNEFLVESEPSQ